MQNSEHNTLKFELTMQLVQRLRWGFYYVNEIYIVTLNQYVT